jgi:hypothetical protein
LACVRDHAIAPTKSSMSRVYDSGRTSYLSCSYGSFFPRPRGWICRGMLGILRARILCTSEPIPPLAAAVLWLGVASSDSFEDPAYHGLHNLVRGLHGDRTPLQVVEVLLPHPASVRPRCEGGNARLRRCLCPPRVGYRLVLLPLSIQPAGRVAERVVLPMERCHCIALRGYR